MSTGHKRVGSSSESVGRKDFSHTARKMYFFSSSDVKYVGKGVLARTERQLGQTLGNIRLRLFAPVSQPAHF